MVVRSLLHLRFYRDEKRFTIHTDDDTLEPDLNLSDNTDHLAQWWFRLPVFGSHVVRGVGATRQAAGEHSRVTTTKTVTSPLGVDLPLLIMDTSTAGFVPETHFVDAHECGSIPHDTIIIVVPTPITHHDISKPQSIQEFLKAWFSHPFCQVTLCRNGSALS